MLLIGVDGVSLNVLEPFMEQGVTPHLGALARRGVRGALASIWPLRTPQVWTSIATGKLPGQHGIWDHLSDTYFNPPAVRSKRRRRVTSADRLSLPLWSILAARGYGSLVVGWSATWPAEAIPKGVMVAPVELLDDPRQTTIKGSFYRDAQQLVAPAALWPQVRGAIVEPQDITPQELAAFADVPPAGHPLYALKHLKRYVYALRWSLARAKSVEALTTGLYRTMAAPGGVGKPALVMAYFQCSDSLLHRFWIFHKSTEEIRARLAGHGLASTDAAALQRRFGGVVQACYRDLDARIGHLLELVADPQTLVLVVSDHGFGDAAVPHRMRDEPYSGAHRDAGVILAAGPQVSANGRIAGAGVLDIAPTVLRALGLPRAADMGGTALTQLLGPQAGAPSVIPSYEKVPQTEISYAEGWPPRPATRR